MAKIKLTDMQFYAYHGCFEEEREIGTHFIVDCELDAILFDAAKTDNLEKTINYQTVYQIIKEEMRITSHLLENVAYRILRSLHHHFPMLKRGQINIYKINPPLGGKVGNVSVKMGTRDVYNIKN